MAQQSVEYGRRQGWSSAKADDHCPKGRLPSRNFAYVGVKLSAFWCSNLNSMHFVRAKKYEMTRKPPKEISLYGWDGKFLCSCSPAR
jgi:hypothetical protein